MANKSEKNEISIIHQKNLSLINDDN